MRSYVFTGALSALNMFTNFLAGGFLLALPIESSLQLHNSFAGCIFGFDGFSNTFFTTTITVPYSHRPPRKRLSRSSFICLLVFLPTPPDSFRALTIVSSKRYPFWQLRFFPLICTWSRIFFSLNVVGDVLPRLPLEGLFDGILYRSVWEGEEEAWL